MAVLSFLFVWFYMAFMNRSWFLATMGMGQVLMSFFTAYMLYFGVFQQRYFGTFNLLSIFIILGIGADDIFVFLDTYRACKVAKPEADLWSTMSSTWRIAGRAMAVTSASTIFSFLSNATSSFPGISTFGIFAACLILVNYCSVILFFPTVVALYETSFAQKKFCCGLFNCCCKKDRVTNCEDPSSETAAATEIGPVETFFRDYFSKFVIKCRWAIILVSLVLIFVNIYFASRLESDPNAPEFFPADNNYAKFMEVKIDKYARGGSIRAQKVSLNFGFAESKISRDGTASTNKTDVGKAVFRDQGVSLPWIAQCVVDMCEHFDKPNNSLKLGGPPYPNNCFMKAFKNWVLALPSGSGGGQANWNLATGPTADSPKFRALFQQWLTSDGVYQKYGKYFGASGTQTDPILRYVTAAEVTLTVDSTMAFETGLQVADSWNAWLKSHSLTAPCSAVGQNISTAFVSSDAWAGFTKQKLMKEEAFKGIFLSLLFAFIILAFATNNVVVAFLSIMCITSVVMCIVGFTVMNGWKLGILESINFVMVPGLSVDFCAHLAEGYMHSHQKERTGKVTDMLVHVGVSIISGAISTLGATTMLFFTTILFFSKFGIFIFMTILYSMYFSLVFFAAVLCVVGPEGDCGSLSCLYRCCKKK